MRPIAASTNIDISETPMHIVASIGCANKVHALILQGLDIDKRRSDGKTALMLAVERNCPQTVRVLLAYDADVNVTDENGQSASRMTFESRDTHPEIVNEFVWVLRKRYSDTEGLVRRLFDVGGNLYHASFLGDVEIMKGLLKLGVSVEAKGFKGRTALHNAVDSNDPIFVSWLLDNNANVNALDDDGIAALHIASVHGNAIIVRWLLDRGANVNVKALDCGLTPLIAVYENSDLREYDECAELLFEYGAVPTQKIGDYPTVLDEALDNGSFYKIDLLICHVALREMQGLCVAKTMLKCKVEEHRYAVTEFEEYLQMCQQVLKMKVFESLTLFDLMSANEYKFRVLMRNKLFCNAIICFLKDRREIYDLYRYYNITMLNRLKKAPGAALEDEATAVVCKIFGGDYNRYFVVSREVIGYLNKRDLEVLCTVLQSSLITAK